MRRMRSLEMVALVLIIVGAINWGLVGLLGVDLVASLFGVGSTLTKLVYVLVGLAGLYELYVLVAARKDVM